tara:strand:+ start:11183 stop:11986 length:804 start_codon:yes stop_codon:yes gene_type:complete
MEQKKIKIFSPGACGTRFLTGIFSYTHGQESPTIQEEILEDICNKFKFRSAGPTHSPYHKIESKDLNTLRKIIFLYGDPRNTFLSICNKHVDRRHRHLLHLGYLGDRSELATSLKDLDTMHRTHIPTRSIQSSREAMTFQRISLGAPRVTVTTGCPDYLEAVAIIIEQIKSFSGLEDHFNSWLHADCPIPIAFVKYEYLLEVFDQLLDFVEIYESRSLIKAYANAEWKPRRSKHEEHTHSDKLNKLFDSLLSIQSQLPPFWIKEPTK